MPLNTLWGQTMFGLLPRVGPKVIVLWVLGSVSTLVTLVFVCLFMWRESRACSKMLEKRPMRPVEVQLARTINFLPLPICIVAFSCLMVPSLAYSCELIIAIITTVVMAGLVHYIMAAFGDGYTSNVLLGETPLKKWWYASYCGGVNDMLPGMGLVYSRKTHQLGVPDIQRAINLVELFIWIFIVTSVLIVSNSLIPTPLSKNEDGYCSTAPGFIDSSMSTIIVTSQILSTFIGSAGFSVIAAAAHHSFEKLDEDGKYNFQKKAYSAFFFLQLPLLKVLLGFIPLAMGPDSASIAASVTDKTVTAADGSFTTSGHVIMCPIFDQEVCMPLLYNCLVTVAMAWLSFYQFRIYTPGQTFDDLRVRFKLTYGEIPQQLKDDSSEEEEEDSDEAAC